MVHSFAVKMQASDLQICRGSFLAIFRMRGRKPHHFFSETQKFWVVSGHLKIQ